MSFGVPEIAILSVSMIAMVFGHHVEKKLGIRRLRFDRTADILIGLGIVAVTMVTFLLLAR